MFMSECFEIHCVLRSESGCSFINFSPFFFHFLRVQEELVEMNWNLPDSRRRGHDVSSQTFSTFSLPRKHFSGGLAALKRDMKKYTKYALAKSTQLVYKIGHKKYIRCCKKYQHSPLPLKQSTLHLFVTFFGLIWICSF